MDGGKGPGMRRGAGVMPMLVALAVPLLVLGGAGVTAAVRHIFAPRPHYGAPLATRSSRMAWDAARHQVLMVDGAGGT